MALIFKVKFRDTLRRWMYVVDTADVPSFQQLETRIREMFHIPPTVSLVITYVDKENDVVTFADDRDVVDACLVQRLNPLRLDVKPREEEVPEAFAPGSTTSPESAAVGGIISQDGTIKSYLKLMFPEGSAAAMKQFLSRYAQVGAAGMFTNAQEGCNEFNTTHARQGSSISYDASQDAHPSSQSASYDPYKHAYAAPPLVAPSRFFHKGVQCDGCGMSPIEGSRFMSTKMSNYDLCSSCFQAMGNETDFLRIDFPALSPVHRTYIPPRPGRGRRHHMGPQTFRPSCARGPYGWKPEFPSRWQPYCPPSEVSGKLDARFVKDVTICNGTELAPSTEFTKIWRLKNTGTLPWPPNTRLVHIGGDVLSSEGAGNLELPEDGLPCGDDVEASIDLIAPEEAGRYVSHWRLMSPSGQKFGHRVWTVIQVVPRDVQSPQESIQEKERTEGHKGEERDGTMSSGIRKGNESVHRGAMIPVIERSEDELASDTQKGKETLIDGIAENGIKAVEKGSTKDHETYTTADQLLAVEKGQLDGSDLLNNEVDGFSVVEKPTQKAELYNISHHIATESKQQLSLDKHREQHTKKPVVDVFKAGSKMDLQLQFLESMGYVDRAFNIYLLRKNKENLELTVDDLIVSSGWDDMLKDLQDMGFDDKSTNRQLLIKNEGSMKRVVKDLVEMEKQNIGCKGKTIRRS